MFDALSECRSSLPESVRWGIADAIERESRRLGYDPLFVQAIVEVESTCSPKARSRKGALGLFQLLPSTARAMAREAGLHWAGPQSLFDPGFNVRLGLLYLSHLEGQLGDLHLAVAAYNLGPTRVAKMSRARVGRNGYLKKVLSRYEDLVEQYA